MDLAALKTQLKNFVQSMFEEGVLDNQFSQIQALQDSTNPNFVEEVITLFCNDAERIINEINRNLGYQNVDFSNLDSYVHQLKGSSSRSYAFASLISSFANLSSNPGVYIIGANRLKLACANLRQASDERNKEG
ncbi:hypothetical protein Goarm_014791 [Gossypium armourianum]|uniref:Histidine-containing phosphotransfer protein n=1 Tax=Gossypium armourianum TaxID=34283 RepID=A0A7J9J7D9_9ROSI|nr:hypothetical protein [Gossypium armourianum]